MEESLGSEQDDSHDKYVALRSVGSSVSSSMWGMFDTENLEQRSVDVRNAWISLTENSTFYNLSTPLYQKKLVSVLYEWRNTSPSMSVRHVANTDNASDTPANTLEMSCCVDGFRIVQYTGEIKAEFCLIFCYGSLSYRSYKSYTQFSEYYNTIRDIHCCIKPIFAQTLRDWEDLQTRKKWLRCLSPRYLVEKSIYLGRFMQSSLFECPTPGLLLEFVQHPGYDCE